jgi:acyl-ACP thioesterase
VDPGRRFSTSRRVRLGDVTPSGRLRLDAVARYLQDVAFDDGEDAGVKGTERWILRRLAIDVTSLPRFTDMVDLTTWCSGAGPRWAERRTTITAGTPLTPGTGATAAIETTAIWVYVDERGRPSRLPPEFFEHWGTSAGDRKVSARLSHPDPPDGAPVARTWPLRRTDFDIVGHVNNAAYWETVEELVAVGPGTWEIEFRDEVPRGTEAVDVVVDGSALWWTTSGRVHASARARPRD